MVVPVLVLHPASRHCGKSLSSIDESFTGVRQLLKQPGLTIALICSHCPAAPRLQVFARERASWYSE
jgi:hypothetical protein